MVDSQKSAVEGIPAGDAKGRYTSSLLVASTSIAIICFLVRVIFDSDTWWLVAIGRDILEKLAVPSIDHFTIAAYGRHYHDSHWLFQVLLALADRIGGMYAVSLVPVAMWGTTFFFCYRCTRRWVSPAAACLLVFLATFACGDRLIPRPEIVSHLMVMVFWFLLQERAYASTRGLVVFALLQAVWSNSHGLFVMGPFLAGCYLVAAFALPGEERAKELSATAKLVVVLLAASLVTPFGLGGWRYALLLFTEVGQRIE